MSQWLNIIQHPNGEPNNASGIEDVTALSGADGHWNDLPDTPASPVFGVAEVATVPSFITNGLVAYYTNYVNTLA